MTFKKLTADEVATYGSDYVTFLRGLKAGEGARADVKGEGVTKITLKKRLQRAADIGKVKVRFHRSPKEFVVLERL